MAGDIIPEWWATSFGNPQPKCTREGSLTRSIRPFLLPLRAPWADREWRGLIGEPRVAKSEVGGGNLYSPAQMGLFSTPRLVRCNDFKGSSKAGCSNVPPLMYSIEAGKEPF
jgi:hypothetical protein